MAGTLITIQSDTSNIVTWKLETDRRWKALDFAPDLNDMCNELNELNGNIVKPEEEEKKPKK